MTRIRARRLAASMAAGAAAVVVPGVSTLPAAAGAPPSFAITNDPTAVGGSRGVTTIPLGAYPGGDGGAPSAPGVTPGGDPLAVLSPAANDGGPTTTVAPAGSTLAAGGTGGSLLVDATTHFGGV